MPGDGCKPHDSDPWGAAWAEFRPDDDKDTYTPHFNIPNSPLATLLAQDPDGGASYRHAASVALLYAHHRPV